MTYEALSLDRYYRGWDRYQSLLMAMIAPLSSEALSWRAAAALRPAWELTAHIIAARVYWFHRLLAEGDPAIAPLQSWDDPGMPQRSADELVDGLNTTWALVWGCLQRWSPAMLDDPFTTPRGFTATRQWVIWHLLEHDLHHGGELFLTLGMHGVTVPEL
jgi:uncharacterized damage-inducible protein DinB